MSDELRARLDAVSAHSDVGEALARAVAPLGDVALAGGGAAFRALSASTSGTIFACAIGMSAVHVLLPDALRERALRCGGDASELGAGWARFTLFRADWPAVDLAFWTRQAYAAARAAR